VFIERNIETIKIDLALKSDFNLSDAFRLFDVSGNGKMTQQDLSTGLE
jgi:Ca2+-binding EF-hand superfamily protein